MVNDAIGRTNLPRKAEDQEKGEFYHLVNSADTDKSK